MELLDIVDENNVMLNMAVERKEAHEKNLWHRHVSCWIMNEDGNVLLQKRAACKLRNPNKWAKTGGHVEAGESVVEGLMREVKEEIGIDLVKEDIELLGIFKSKDIQNNFFGYDFFVKVNYKIEDYVLQEEELSEVKYFSIEEIEKLKEEKNSNYTFTAWDDNDFWQKINFLKKKRVEFRCSN